MDMREFFKLATGEIAGPTRVGRVRPKIQSALDASTGAVWLSRESLEKQFARHGRLSTAYYEHLRSAIERGEAFRLDGDRVGLVLVYGLRHILNYRLHVVVKVTGAHDELCAISFYPLREKDWDRTERKFNRIPN